VDFYEFPSQPSCDFPFPHTRRVCLVTGSKQIVFIREPEDGVAHPHPHPQPHPHPPSGSVVGLQLQFPLCVYFIPAPSQLALI